MIFQSKLRKIQIKSNFVKKTGVLFSICGLACIAEIVFLSLLHGKTVALILDLLLFELGIILRNKHYKE